MAPAANSALAEAGTDVNATAGDDGDEGACEWPKVSVACDPRLGPVSYNQLTVPTNFRVYCYGGGWLVEKQVMTLYKKHVLHIS